jgi:hypothetical protein
MISIGIVKQSSHDGGLTAPTATMCVWMAAGDVLVLVAELVVAVLDTLCARTELSKAVENITAMLSNIVTPFFNIVKL